MKLNSANAIVTGARAKIVGCFFVVVVAPVCNECETSINDGGIRQTLGPWEKLKQMHHVLQKVVYFEGVQCTDQNNKFGNK